MKLRQHSTTKVLVPTRSIQFIDEIYHTDQNGKRQGRCEKHGWFEVADNRKADEINKQNNVWSIGDPNRRPAFAYLSERGTYKDDEMDGPWVQFGTDGSIISIDSYQSGKCRGVCMKRSYGTDTFYFVGENGDKNYATQEEIETLKKQVQEMIQDTNYHSSWVHTQETYDGVSVLKEEDKEGHSTAVKKVLEAGTKEGKKATLKEFHSQQRL